MLLSLAASECGRRRLIREVAVLLVVSLIAVDGKVPLGRVVMGGRGGTECLWRDTMYHSYQCPMALVTLYVLSSTSIASLFCSQCTPGIAPLLLAMHC